jgi:membrane-associated protease RseP (regulator of RpoE activity)
MNDRDKPPIPADESGGKPEENIFWTKEIETRKRSGFIINVILFILTFFTTTLAGVFWANRDPFELSNLQYGITYSILIMLVITTHEFGHYFAARIHRVPVTLPYYIPFPFLFLNPFGTMGAVIRLKSRQYTRKALFDIGVAGPIAGWVTSMIILLIGFLTLPPLDHIFEIHPEYRETGIPLEGFSFGYNIVFWVFEKLFASSPGVFMPPMNEVYHYPFLCVGWFGLLITALNMMPVGQLDGGHISYTMFGDRHKYLAYTVFGALIFFGLLGLLPLAGINMEIGSINWLVWALLILFIIRIKHPPALQPGDPPLSSNRMLIGWFTFFIFVVSFCPVPFYGV